MTPTEMRTNKLNNFLIGTLFLFIALLLGALGLKLDPTLGINKVANILAIIGGISSFTFLYIGVMSAAFSARKIIPSKVRIKLTNEFEKAEENVLAYCKKINFKTFLFKIYFYAVTLSGLSLFIGVSLKIFTNPIFLIALPFTFIALCPIFRSLRLFLLKGRDDGESGDITKDEFPATYDFISQTVNSTLGKNYKLKIDFGSEKSVSVEIRGGKVFVNLNSYALMLFTKSELIALLKRETLCLLNREYKKLNKVENSRKLFTEVRQNEIVFSLYFSFIISNTSSRFLFAKNAIERQKEKIADGLISTENLSLEYLKAYKKQQILDCCLVDSRSFINLYMIENEDNLKNLTKSVFTRFLELLPKFKSDWERKVERKLKAKVTDRLVYSEKLEGLKIDGVSVDFEDNSDDEAKEIHYKYDKWYYDKTKDYNHAKRQSYEEYKTEIFRYEQNPEDYNERLKLITVAHAYYMLAELEKAESVYSKIIKSGDLSPETCFDYGCFLLLAKDEFSGVDYIYKAMENENLTDSGLEILGRFLIYYGDKNEYEKYCDFKSKKLDNLVSGIPDRTILPNAKLTETGLELKLVEEIKDKLILDDNINEIYCADAKAKSGKKITLFGVSVRNKTEEAYFKTFERIFSILDNDYGQIDSILISMDFDSSSGFVKKMKKNQKYLIFKK